MTTIQKVNKHVQALALYLHTKEAHPRFSTGVAALATKGLISLNANGRSLDDNRWTGEARIRRTVTDERFRVFSLRLSSKSSCRRAADYASVSIIRPLARLR